MLNRFTILSVLLAVHVSSPLLTCAQPAPPSAAASPTPADVEAVIASPEYKELIREGMLKYTRGFWPEALAFFQKAHQLAPNARTLRGLALVSYDAHHYVDATEYAEQALSHPVQPLNEKMAEELKQLLQQAQGMVARVQLVTTPAAVELRIDGKLATRRADGDVWADPGAHYLTVSAPGFAAETQQLQLIESSQTRLEVKLASRVAPSVASGGVAQPLKTEPTAGSPLPWVVVGVSAALAAVGGILIAVDQRGESPTGKTTAGAVLLGVGGFGLAAGLTWSLWPRPQPERAPAAQLRLGPTSLQLRGSF